MPPHHGNLVGGVQQLIVYVVSLIHELYQFGYLLLQFMGQRSPSHSHQRYEDPWPSPQEPRATADLIRFTDATPPQLRHDKFRTGDFPSTSPSSFKAPSFSREASPGVPVPESPVFQPFPRSNPLSSPSCSETEPHPVLRPRSSTALSYFKEGTDTAVSPVYATGEPAVSSSSRKEMELVSREVLALDPLMDSGTHHSLENLLEDSMGGGMEEEMETTPPTSSPRRVSRFKKLKDRFGKKKQKSVEQKSVEQKDGPESPRKTRSKSERPNKGATGVAKPRSQSEFSPQPMERSQSPPSPALNVSKKRRSYTMLTGHITAKYQALDARQKSEKPPPKRGGDYTKLRLYENVKFSVAEMTPERFRKTLYCEQLQYKLRFALQNIHTPLTTSPVYLQLCADEDSMCDSRYQLITLLHHALQQSKWQHNAMEIALLTEILRMVEPLSNWL